MKKQGLFGAAALSALFLLTSCLGDTGNSQSMSYVPSVVTTSPKNYKTLLTTAAGVNVYNESIIMKGFGEGDCLLADFTIDFNDPLNANAGANGYYNAALSNMLKVDKVQARSFLGDTSKLMDDELVITNALELNGINAIVENHLFLTSLFTQLSKQKTAWHMFYDSSLTPEKVNEKNVYTLFLRATLQEKGSTPSVEGGVLNAYNIKSFIEGINSREQAAGNEAYNVKIRYIKSIDKDNPTKATWSSTEPSQIELRVPKKD